jgi:signal transduction histidine kinase
VPVAVPRQRVIFFAHGGQIYRTYSDLRQIGPFASPWARCSVSLPQVSRTRSRTRSISSIISRGVSADELQEALEDVNLNEKRCGEITELMQTLRGNLEKVVQHGQRADSIVKNMLLHSREGSGEHRVVDTNALVEESLNLAYHGARAEKQGFTITLERSLDPTAGQIDVFPQEITRALLNLISNGFYAATKRKAEVNDGEPTLAASTKSLGDRVEIRIRDNGTYSARGQRKDVQSVLYDQACRRRHRTWALNQS